MKPVIRLDHDPAKWCSGSRDIPFFILHAVGKLTLEVQHCGNAWERVGAVGKSTRRFSVVGERSSLSKQ